MTRPLPAVAGLMKYKLQNFELNADVMQRILTDDEAVFTSEALLEMVGLKDCFEMKHDHAVEAEDVIEVFLP